MSYLSNSILTFDNEDKKSGEPIVIKTSYTEEIYYGNTLKSRIELNKCCEVPQFSSELRIFSL